MFIIIASFRAMGRAATYRVIDAIAFRVKHNDKHTSVGRWADEQRATWVGFTSQQKIRAYKDLLYFLFAHVMVLTRQVRAVPIVPAQATYLHLLHAVIVVVCITMSSCNCSGEGRTERDVSKERFKGREQGIAVLSIFQTLCPAFA
jgi:hypothetical protein